MGGKSTYIRQVCVLALLFNIIESVALWCPSDGLKFHMGIDAVRLIFWATWCVTFKRDLVSNFYPVFFWLHLTATRVLSFCPLSSPIR